MARKARRRISYVLPLADSPGGHRLGINGLAVDSDQSVLYSGGRDGVICAWDLKLPSDHIATPRNPFSSSRDTPAEANTKTTSTSFRSQVQAHTHWVNDIILTQSNTALVSASSDITVKVWRPHAEDGRTAQTVGLHDDYVKCLATPTAHSDWVASGGLDHTIRLWDLNGGGEKLKIAVGDDENKDKGSVYALSVRGSIMASGGPESIVRLWDPRTGNRITKFVGHTDNVRSILINEAGDTIMTASSDQTIKVWSLGAGRCMHTLSMHNDSVWTLYSDHPQLSIFYSADRSGLIAKTDVRGSTDMDDGLSLAIAQEHEGVTKLVASSGYLWTATSSSSINRWKDVDTRLPIQEPKPTDETDEISANPKNSSISDHPSHIKAERKHNETIPFKSVLRISNTAPLTISKIRPRDATTIYSGSSMRKPSEAVIDTDQELAVPIYRLPEETIEGQNGLIKHVMLNDRKRVLTLDTAGDVTMWDLLKCVPLKSFGKRHLEDVTPEVNTMESVGNWCAVDTRTGQLAVILEENYCFDAEMYSDEAEIDENIDFREDQRINLGKWVLRYLFANLVDEQIRRDEIYRARLPTTSHQMNGPHRDGAPPLTHRPLARRPDLDRDREDSESVITPRAVNGHYPAATPGLGIGIATPGAVATNHNINVQNHIPSTIEEGSTLEKRKSLSGNTRTSGDYFSSNPTPQLSQATNGRVSDGSSAEAHLETVPQSTSEAEKDTKGGSIFGKKFRMSFPKKLGRSSAEAKPAAVDDKSETSDRSSEKEDKVFEDNFTGSLQKIRQEYDEQLQHPMAGPSHSGINPSLPNETPILKPPSLTTIIIQEDRPESGGVADLYQGTVRSVGEDADLIEKAAPLWLGDLLLRNQIPQKEIVKISFVLQPYQDLLPAIPSVDGNCRLNANRMLRAKKILLYVAERIEPMPEHPDPHALKPEEYLELYCQGQLVPPNMTLATLRAHIYKSGGDIMLYYKSNGQKPELEKRTRIPATVDGV